MRVIYSRASKKQPGAPTTLSQYGCWPVQANFFGFASDVLHNMTLTDKMQQEEEEEEKKKPW